MASTFAWAAAVLLVGEIIYRGPRATWVWLHALPQAALVATAVLVLSILALHVLLSLRAAIAVVSFLFLAFSMADRAKQARLGLPVWPPDFLLWDQYATLARMIWGWKEALLAALVIAALAYGAWRARHRWLRRRTPALPLWLGATALVAMTYIVLVPDYSFRNARLRQNTVATLLDTIGIHNINWAPLNNVQTNGQVLAFLMNARSVLKAAPPGYSEDAVRSALCAEPAPPAPAPEPPDVVVIMSEAWWDPSLLPGVQFSDPLLNGLHSTGRGTLFSPVFGGYTANSEFEFLTRMSMGFLPAGSVPYLEYVHRPLQSLARVFKRAGYEAIAVHPFDPSFWNRSNVYPQLGFDVFHDMTQFTHRELKSPYISDHAMALEINDLLDKPGARPRFVFAVSVQNHGPYTSPDARYASSELVRINAAPDTLSAGMRGVVATYATGVRDAVAAFNVVADHAAARQRPTIVVMFGDHLPFLGTDFGAFVESGFIKSADDQRWSNDDVLHMHQVPVVAWWNTPRPVVLPSTAMSPIYLGQAIEKAAGVTGDAMDRLAERMHGDHPIMSTFYSAAPHGESRGAPADDDAGVHPYATVEYDQIFGKNFTERLVGDKGEVRCTAPPAS